MMTAAVGWQCPDCVKTGAKNAPTQRVTFNRNFSGAVGMTNPTPVTIVLIAINVVVFFLSGFGKASVLDRYGEVPALISVGHQYYRLLDAMFLHVNVLHIASNMVTLLIIGPAVEVLLGRVRFVALYLIGGFGGAVAYYVLGPSLGDAVGASGAIFALMTAYVVLAHNRRLPVQQVVALIAINLIITFSDTQIAWQDHVGSLVVGAVLALVYDQAWKLRPQVRAVAATVGASAAMVAVLTVILLSYTPSLPNLGSG
jgi:membrane associated rhomboid family serine protease